MPLDAFGKDLSSLQSKRLFIFDMDGTIYTDDQPYSGSIELMKSIHAVGGEYVFFTNNSSKSVNDYLNKVRELGIFADKQNFCTSVDAVVSYLNSKHPNELVFCVGTQSLIEGLKSENIRTTTSPTDTASVALLGYDTELTYDKIRDLCVVLSRNVTYLATNMDLACPTSFGFVPDCGAIAEMVFLATNRKPLFLGKPSPFLVEEAMRRFGCTRKETVVIGDRLYTDIAAGASAHVDSICVLTGEASLEDIEAGDINPTYTVNSIADVLAAIQ